MLLLGASGQVGKALESLLPDVVAIGRSEVDLSVLSHRQAVELLGRVVPDVVINCAAYTAVDKAEDEEDLAAVINGESVGILATATAERSIPFVTYSTDYVFPGTADRPYVESDLTSPVNAYGRSKLVGEKLALQASPLALVIRTSWVISGTHRNFVSVILDRARKGELKVVDDQHGCPTIAADLAGATLEAIAHRARGLLHLTNTGPTTWYELAREAVKAAGLDADLVTPCRSEDFPTKAKRPAYSVMKSERRGSLGISPLPNWRDSLPSVVPRTP